MLQVLMTLALVGMFVLLAGRPVADSRRVAPRQSHVALPGAARAPATHVPATPAAKNDSSAIPAVTFTATAYCQSGITRSGVNTRSGIAAGDPEVLPVGSVVQVETPLREHRGIYTVLDTGGKVLGRKLDLFIRDCDQAQQFGRRSVRVTVLRKGWSPKGTLAF